MKLQYHLKRKLRTIVIQIWNEQAEIVMKKFLKNWFFDFQSQKIMNRHQSRRNFWKTLQDSKKTTWLPSRWDVYGFWDILRHGPVKNCRQFLDWWAAPVPPPHMSFRVKWKPPAHWDFLCSDRSNLNLMRWWIFLIPHYCFSLTLL